MIVLACRSATITRGKPYRISSGSVVVVACILVVLVIGSCRQTSGLGSAAVDAEEAVTPGLPAVAEVPCDASATGGLRGTGGGDVPKIRLVPVYQAMVKGPLSPEVVRRIIHLHLDEIRFCYEQALADDPTLSGRAEIELVISGTGAVLSAEVISSTLGSEAVEGCIAKAAKRWTFPLPEGGGTVTVKYPIVLEPGSRVGT